jgi:hypothetical protein
MASAPVRSEDTVAYQGEVWTDGRGLATVRLPSGAGTLEPPIEYELRELDAPPSSARITAPLKHRRFTIATEQPHVKVAWRISGRSTGQAAPAQPSTTTNPRRETRT